jgi:hypothetical protein
MMHTQLLSALARALVQEHLESASASLATRASPASAACAQTTAAAMASATHSRRSSPVQEALCTQLLGTLPSTLAACAMQASAVPTALRESAQVALM